MTGLRGCFAYVHIADPENGIYESNEDNNEAQLIVKLPFRPERAPRRLPRSRPRASSTTRASTLTGLAASARGACPSARGAAQSARVSGSGRPPRSWPLAAHERAAHERAAEPGERLGRHPGAGVGSRRSAAGSARRAGRAPARRACGRPGATAPRRCRCSRTRSGRARPGSVPTCGMWLGETSIGPPQACVMRRPASAGNIRTQRAVGRARPRRGRPPRDRSGARRRRAARRPSRAGCARRASCGSSAPACGRR